MKIDLHVHTRERSTCARSSEDEQIQAAIAVGLDAIVITDHHAFVPPQRLVELNRQYAPFRVFGGIEITSDGEDFLVVGVHHPALESSAWKYPALHAFIRERGGWIGLAHPYRYRPGINVDLDQFPPDAIEIYSANTPANATDLICSLAARHRLALLANSDAHTTERLGTYYNYLDGNPANDAELAVLLKAGRITGNNQTCDTPLDTPGAFAAHNGALLTNFGP
jgi:histidinol phosphatase-like PHP family hydrolase